MEDKAKGIDNTEERSLIKDMFKDAKHQRRMLMVVIFIQFIVIAGLICGLIKTSLHHQDVIKEMAEEHNRQTMELLSETEFVTEYTIETDHQSLNNGNITVNKP